MQLGAKEEFGDRAVSEKSDGKGKGKLNPIKCEGYGDEVEEGKDGGSEPKESQEEPKKS